MANKTTNLNIRIEATKKAEAEKLYQELGLTLPQAINIFITKTLLVGGLPFDVRLPRYGPGTEAAMQEARDIAAGKIQTKTYRSAAELFGELDAE